MWPKGSIERQPSTDKPLEGFVMPDDNSTNTAKSAQRRLLEAMVTLNAINNGRPVPDMDKITNGWVLPISASASRKEMRKRIVNAISEGGINIRPKPDCEGQD